MKSILQFVTVLSVVALLASCGGNSDGDPRGQVTITPPPEQDGLGGTALKGTIIGGTVTVLDADGNNVPVASGGVTGADGTYDITLSPDVSLNSLTLPLLIRVSGGNGATSVCDVNNNGTDDDCLTNDGVTYVAFRETFELPADFVLESVLAVLPADTPGTSTSFTANITPATHLQAALAREAVGAGASLTVEAVQEAEQEVLGLIESITGVEMENVSLATIAVQDVAAVGADTANGTAQSLAISAFAAAVAGLVDATDETQNDVQEVLVNLVVLVTSGDDGLEITGIDIAELSTAVAESFGDITEALVEAGVDNEVADAVVAAQSAAEQKAYEGQLIGSGILTLPPAMIDPTSDSPKLLANEFLDKFINVLTVWTDVTGAEEGTTNVAPTEILFTELADAETYGAGAATEAFDSLMEALIAEEAQLEAGSSITNDETSEDGLLYTLDKDAAGVVTLMNAQSVTTGKEGVVRTTITIAEGTWQRDPGVSGEFDLTDVVLLTEMVGETDSQLQHFTGNVNAVFAPDATDPGDLGLTTLTYDGTHRGTSSDGDTFTIHATLSNLSGTAVEGGSGQNIDGDYSITFTFDGDQNIAFNLNGTFRDEVQSFWIRAGGLTTAEGVSMGGDLLMGTLSESEDTDNYTVTDGTALLTVIIDIANEPPTLGSAVITVGETEVATINEDGLVTFSDDSIRFLPAGLL